MLVLWKGTSYGFAPSLWNHLGWLVALTCSIKPAQIKEMHVLLHMLVVTCAMDLTQSPAEPKASTKLSEIQIRLIIAHTSVVVPGKVSLWTAWHH